MAAITASIDEISSHNLIAVKISVSTGMYGRLFMEGDGSNGSSVLEL
jgi:hypothetical protein